MNKTFLTIAALLCSSLVITASNSWVSLFDGETLNGWEKHGGDASYQVKDGVIWGINGPGHNTFLCTNKTYGDFELEFDVLLIDPINSGVQIRSKFKEGTKNGKKVELIYGPQIEIEQGPAEAGYLYGEQAGGWMTAKEDLIAHDAFKNVDWNHYRIVARGARIQTYINGRQISDLVDEKIYQDHKEGLIGLQVHQIGKPEGTMKVAWRNIRIRETDSDGWVSMFNGKNLDGWTPKVRGHKLGKTPATSSVLKTGR